MIFLKDKFGHIQQARYLIEYASIQPATNEVFWQVMAVGYDGIRRVPLYSFNKRSEMHRKYMELRKEYDEQLDKELERRGIKK